MASKKERSPFDRLIDAIESGNADAVEQAAHEAVEVGVSSPVERDRLVEALKAAHDVGDHDRVARLSARYAEHLRSNAVRYPETFSRELSRAVDTFDREQAARLCRQLVAHHRTSGEPYPLSAQDEVLYTLQRKRYFDLMIEVGDTLILRNGPVAKDDDPGIQKNKLKIRRRYAQALIDNGQLTAALAVLEPLAAEAETHAVPGELAEARGLIGRAYKQFYMDAATQETEKTEETEEAEEAEEPGEKPRAQYQAALGHAVDAYGEVYQKDASKAWHGINTIALVERARRDGASGIPDKWNTASEAKKILDRIGKSKAPNLWDSATAAEACLALGRYDEALEWTKKYTEATGADAFEYASTLRQFEEVWGLEAEEKDQAKILQLLRSALLKKDGGEVAIHDPAREVETAHELQTDGEFEKVLGQDRFKTYHWYVTGLDRATAVAKVYDPVRNGVGTGFLVRGTDIHPSLTHPWLFVTNAHVISDDPREQNATPRALAPEDATIIFQAGPDANKQLSVGELIYTSRRNDLDCTILSLSEAVSFDKPFRISRRLPRIQPDKHHRVYVIGHPRGAGLSFSLHDNLLLDHEAPKVHYRAPTEGGSSGSPVFDANWDLVALHHVGSESIRKLNTKPGVYGANEGIFLHSILQAVEEKLG